MICRKCGGSIIFSDNVVYLLNQESTFFFFYPQKKNHFGFIRWSYWNLFTVFLWWYIQHSQIKINKQIDCIFFLLKWIWNQFKTVNPWFEIHYLIINLHKKTKNPVIVKWLRKHVHIMLPKSITLKVNSSL